MDFAVPSDHREKLKESEKKDIYLELARDLKKMKLKMSFVPIVIRALGTVIKELMKGLEDLEIRGQVETIQTTALLRLLRILRRVLETGGDSSKRVSAITDVKNSQRMNNNNNRCPIGWGCRIHRLLPCRGVRPHSANKCPGMTLNNLMVRFQ